MNNKMLGFNRVVSTYKKPEESTTPYYEDLDKALFGLERALERHSGKIGEVKNDDITAFSNIDPDILENLFKNADGLVKEIYKEIGALFISLDRDLTSFGDVDALLWEVFRRLGKKSSMLNVILILDEYSVWERSLRNITKRVADGWPSDPKGWEYLYEAFCFQFHSVILLWSKSLYDEENIQNCVHTLKLWIRADESVGRAMEDKLL